MSVSSSVVRGLMLVATATSLACDSGSATGPEMADQIAAARGSGTAGAAATSDRVRVIITLAPVAGGGFNQASGKAKWDSRNGNSKRELQMEAESLVPGTQVAFFIGDTQVGSATAGAFGEAKLELSTQLGHMVPLSVSGLRAEARTAGGAVIVTGIFP